MTARFANRLVTEPRFAIAAAYAAVVLAFGLGMALAAIAYALIG